ncbi:MAG TPA: hypothetical protein VKU02_04185 [Gemmataceae bacterium]|nr:hypothetical protein [Gemmataceae bacterium]
MKPSTTDSPDVMTLQIRRDNSGRASIPDIDVETAIPAAETAPLPETTPPAETTPAAPPCPRCGGRLTNPEGLGWCPGCGYCRSLEQDANKAALAAPPVARRPSPFGVVEFVEVLGKLPRWLWVLLGGTAILVVGSFGADFVLEPNSLARALWSSVQLALGVIALLAAQVWAFLLLAPESEHMSAKDLILSARLWSMTCRRLPKTRPQVWLGAWGMVAGTCAVLVVGGLDYWYQFYKPKKLVDRGLLAMIQDAANKAHKKNQSMEEALDELAGKQDLAKKKDEPKKETKDDRRPVVDCVIVGYTVATNQKLGKERITSLMLATLIDGKIKFAGVVRRGFEGRASDDLLRRLTPLVQNEPFIRGLNTQAIWVKPKVFCEIRQSGFDADGHLKDPNFKDLLSE